LPGPWYIDGFGRLYLELYAHRDEEEAGQAVALLRAAGVELSGQRLLDLGCGAGRHLAMLGRQGARPIGLDLSWPLLGEARRLLGPEAELIHSDMRILPLASASCDGVLSMFTSFGYFDRDEENWRVIGEVARVLRPGAFFLFDFLNRRRVEEIIEARSEKVVGRWRVTEERRIERGRVHKRVRISERETGREELSYEESVRLFRPAEIRAEAARRGFEEERVCGGYRGEDFAEEKSSRFLILLRRASA